MFGRPIASIFVWNRYLFQCKALTGQVPKFCHHGVIKQPMNDEMDNHQDAHESKLLKVAVIGMPNVGKSTLVNQLVRRRIFAMSKKVHTTQCRARGVYIEDKSQLVFLDTPGLVTTEEKKRYNLEQEFVEGGKKAASEADTLLVIHDASNAYTRFELDEKITTILNAFPDKNAALVINKVDALKKKRFLLDMARLLTNDSLKKISEEVKTINYKPIKKESLEKRISRGGGYSNFNDIFMVSALEGTGIEDLRNYLLSLARPAPWLFSEEIFTDQDPVVIIQDTVRSRMLNDLPQENYLLSLARPAPWLFSEEIFTDQDPVIIIQDTVRSRMLNDLPQEVPYRATVLVEYLDFERDEPVCVCLIECPSERVERVVKGPGGMRIRRIATAAEEELRMTFRIPLKLKVVTTNKTPKTFG